MVLEDRTQAGAEHFDWIGRQIERELVDLQCGFRRKVSGDQFHDSNPIAA